MSTAPTDTAAPAIAYDTISGQIIDQYAGFTAQEAAAIALRVPDSGNEWLDKMIRTAQRNDLAKAAMQALCTHADTWGLPSREAIANESHKIADAMLSGAATPTGE